MVHHSTEFYGVHQFIIAYTLGADYELILEVMLAFWKALSPTFEDLIGRMMLNYTDVADVCYSCSVGIHSVDDFMCQTLS